jgi:hypothetical protein
MIGNGSSEETLDRGNLDMLACNQEVRVVGVGIKLFKLLFISPLFSAELDIHPTITLSRSKGTRSSL